jgi:hypothetical protein
MGSKLLAWRLGSGIFLAKPSRSAAKVANSKMASLCSTHSYVALVGVFIGGPDSDDTLRA